MISASAWQSGETIASAENSGSNVGGCLLAESRGRKWGRVAAAAAGPESASYGRISCPSATTTGSGRHDRGSSGRNRRDCHRATSGIGRAGFPTLAQFGGLIWATPTTNGYSDWGDDDYSISVKQSRKSRCNRQARLPKRADGQYRGAKLKCFLIVSVTKPARVSIRSFLTAQAQLRPGDGL
jgi:hypothetical protein